MGSLTTQVKALRLFVQHVWAGNGAIAHDQTFYKVFQTTVHYLTLFCICTCGGTQPLAEPFATVLAWAQLKKNLGVSDFNTQTRKVLDLLLASNDAKAFGAGWMSLQEFCVRSKWMSPYATTPGTINSGKSLTT